MQQVLGRHAVQGADAIFVTVVVCHRMQVVDLPDGLFRTVVQTLQEHGFLPALQTIIYRLLLGRGQGEIEHLCLHREVCLLNFV